jgi:hypothetical protein
MKRTPVLIIIALLLSAFFLLGSQQYTADVYDPNHVAATDLQNMEYNFDALKTNFSGASAPANPSAHQWWADTTNNILKYRNAANTAWLDIYDFSNNVFMAGVDTGLITATMISDGARKPSLVTDQTITPANCNATTEVSAPSGTFTNLNATNFVAPYSVIASVPSALDQKTSNSVSPGVVYTLRVYVPASASYMRMSARLRSEYVGGNAAYARFSIGGSSSSAIGNYGQSYAWFDNSEVNVSSLYGYYNLTIELWTGASGETAYLDGLTVWIQ